MTFVLGPSIVQLHRLIVYTALLDGGLGRVHISDHCGQNIPLLVLTSHHFICQDNFKCHGWIPLNLHYNYMEIVFNSSVSSVKSLPLNININMTGKYWICPAIISFQRCCREGSWKEGRKCIFWFCFYLVCTLSFILLRFCFCFLSMVWWTVAFAMQTYKLAISIEYCWIISNQST